MKLDYHLQRFSDVMIDDIKIIMKSSSDNHAKADILSEYLEPRGFIEIGLGTNIIVYVHKDEAFKIKMRGSKKKVKWYSCVYKIALDEFGLYNNWDDVDLSQAIPEFAEVYEVRKDGLISVQEYCKVFDKETYVRGYIKKTYKLLDRLAEDYLLIDVSPKNLKNYGLDPDGKLKIIDGSDLIPLWDTLKIECPAYLIDKAAYDKGKVKTRRCKGDLVYDEIYHTLVCTKCGQEHNPVIFRKPWIEVDINDPSHYSTGLEDMTAEEIKEWRANFKEHNAAMLESITTYYRSDDVDRLHPLTPDEYREEVAYYARLKEEAEMAASQEQEVAKSVEEIEDEEVASYMPAPLKAVELEDDVDDDVVTITYDQLKAIFGGKEVRIEGFMRVSNPYDDEEEELSHEEELPEDEEDSPEWAASEDDDGMIDERSILVDEVEDETLVVQASNVSTGISDSNEEHDDYPETDHETVAVDIEEVSSIIEADSDDEEEEEDFIQTSAPVHIERPKPIGGNISIGDGDDEDDEDAYLLDPFKLPPVDNGHPAKKKKKKKKK